MKKFAALAVLAAVSASSYAQSSVTLFGVADATVQVGRGSIANKTGLGSGGNATSRIGFRGVEDLGSGLKAGFWLEAGYNVDTGAGNDANIGSGLAFTRRATVSLMGDNWGEVRLGRDFTAVYNNVYDPFGDNGAGAGLKSDDLVGYGLQTRTSNAVSYFTPKTLGGFFGQAQIFRGEVTGSNSGNGYGLRLGYENGPLSVGVAYSQTTDLNASDITLTPPVAVNFGDVKRMSVGGSYDFGVAKLLLNAGQDKSQLLDEKTRYYLVGASVPVGGVGEVRGSWTRASVSGGDARADKFAVGYVHNLSKRTALYTTFAYVKNRDDAAVALNGSATGFGDNSKGLDIGLRHAF